LYVFIVKPYTSESCNTPCEGQAKYLWPQLNLNVFRGPPESRQHSLMSPTFLKTEADIIKTVNCGPIWWPGQSRNCASQSVKPLWVERIAGYTI